ncbi:cation diffusion facilitator family transporter [Actinoplanes sichuanensis]|uniref:Cation diffusion facilitator family transporter n=1 Tax=Actinoplanes sichuanensis TaxID=512349 RepID=A0ABW4AGD1_9ACTN|nr:cation diffusion facilitator family transporter [Actinoplanes sichuanensis]
MSTPETPESESVGTVLVAGAANLAIAVAKLVAGLISGSAAMLSEAAHSLADTVTEVFLYVALRRGAKPADEQHPFGYGKESWVWAFIAAIFMFVAGAGFSIYHGVMTILEGEHTGNYLASYLVLAVAFVAESVSFAKALKQVRGAARRWDTTLGGYLRHTSDTTVKAVFFEDLAALTGLLLAAAGLGLAQVTGSEMWDGVASILIGLLLLVVAVVLGHSNASLLVGQAVPQRMYDRIAADLAGIEVVTSVPTLLTMRLGPGGILVAAKVDFADDVPAVVIETACDEAERRLRETFPEIRYVFLDPTRATADPTGVRSASGG